MKAPSNTSNLESKIRDARISYTAGNPSVSDAVYDAWIEELRSLNPGSVELKAIGAPPLSEWQKVRHDIPMGSLEKVNTPEELEQWVNQYKAENLLVTEKLDGLSVALTYVDGKLARAATRGDGQMGEDITVNVARMKGVPKNLSHNISVQIRGEIVLLKSDLAKHFPEYKNPRNAASGITKRLDGVGVQHLTVIVYQLAEGMHIQSRAKQIQWLKSEGFIVPTFSTGHSVETVTEVWEVYQKSTRDALDYDIDGLVVEIDDSVVQLGLGEKDGRPHGARAFKFAPMMKESTLRAIVNQTGATGRIVPVGVYDPVELMGATVTNASLYNWTQVRSMGLDVGAKALIYRANDVIPKTGEVTYSTGTIAQPPTECPSCKTEPVWEGEYLVCPNTSKCPAQAVGRLQRYISELNILEWGESVLTKLVESGAVSTVPDLYRLKKEQLLTLDRMGEKTADKLLKLLWEKNPIPLETFLGALSIPTCGSSTFVLLADAGYDTLEKIQGMKPSQYLAIAGLGPIKAETLFTWFMNNSKLISDTLTLGVKLKERVKGNLTGTSFCFTGKSTMKRADLEELVKSKGGTVKGSVGKGLTYLVMADPSSGSSKAQAAQKHGTKTISEADFLAMVK